MARSFNLPLPSPYSKASRAERDVHADGDEGLGEKIEIRASASGNQKSELLSEYVRKNELARQFGVSGRTIERWVRLRLIPAPVRLGRTSLYHLPTIQKHLAHQTHGDRGRRSRS